MHEYLQITFEQSPAELTNILIARLSEIGFTGFDESGRELAAFILSDNFDEESFLQTIPAGLHFRKQIIEDRNWNEEWERSFVPVIVDDFCAVRASFHSPVNDCRHEIIITPKMSFGTGHHATTYQMIELMKTVDFRRKTVLDFGAGTGILAILAEKCGAVMVAAIDNDHRSIENAMENSGVNNCRNIAITHASDLPAGIKYDVILANINKNVILAELGNMEQILAPEGVLLISGLLSGDKQEIVEKAFKNRLSVVVEKDKDSWIALLLSRF